MRLVTGALLLFAALALSAATDDLTGTWTTIMVEPPAGSGQRPMHSYEPSFEFKLDGSKVTGRARMDEYPGNAPISDGKIDGNRVSFTMTHEQPYFSGRTPLVQHYTTFKCTGTLRGNEMDLTMTPLSDDGTYDSRNVIYVMKATKVSP
jgi:hypothetical protein